ncbi:uncharacterized protein HMPREF1120_02793 [Exophiala dermatitidis NIH/UT8656]|uniref:Uncharacterized protein n=1 Tax=Exophiala dermatitidis (strain ATCC 34100 / CBS 525.76 / NIH/UT8656) TaxID=858893 RepID=H6BQZ1_EXODN|nr:uncharacterized protein HMPREF1120_02793 [Exophiala dermatitidis NIH/UT8656]EHY54626.1 hypothetical protein HMPREF1120_02793 [Exophiala dermatitidis NIH/UT8656]
MLLSSSSCFDLLRLLQPSTTDSFFLSLLHSSGEVSVCVCSFELPPCSWSILAMSMSMSISMTSVGCRCLSCPTHHLHVKSTPASCGWSQQTTYGLHDSRSSVDYYCTLLENASHSS